MNIPRTMYENAGRAHHEVCTRVLNAAESVSNKLLPGCVSQGFADIKRAAQQDINMETLAALLLYHATYEFIITPDFEQDNTLAFLIQAVILMASIDWLMYSTLNGAYHSYIDRISKQQANNGIAQLSQTDREAVNQHLSEADSYRVLSQKTIYFMQSLVSLIVVFVLFNKNITKGYGLVTSAIIILGVTAVPAMATCLFFRAVNAAGTAVVNRLDSVVTRY